MIRIGETAAMRDFERKFAEAEAMFDRRRARGVELYGWDPSCECHECGDTGINPDKNKLCWCEPGQALRDQRDRKGSWITIAPPHHRECRLATHPHPNAREIGEAWLRDDYPANRGLLLAGGTGVGKTGLAIAIAYELHLQGVPVKFANVPDVMAVFLEAVGTDDRSAKARSVELQHGLVDTGVLVLDDLGAQRVTPFTVERLYEIVNTRHTRNLPTIITTNLTKSGIEQSIGERVMSRLYEISTVRELRGSDLRTMRLVGAA